MMHLYGNGDRNSLKRHRAPQDRKSITGEEGQVTGFYQSQNKQEAQPSRPLTHLFTQVNNRIIDFLIKNM